MVCKFYKKFKNKSFLDTLLKDSFKALLLKRQKLKTGSITFTFKTFSFYNITIFQWFEMEYKSQPSADAQRKAIDQTMQTLSLKKDLQTALLLILSILIFLTYFNYYLDTYILNLVLPSTSDIIQKNIFLSTIQMFLPKMVILNNMFSIIFDSQIALSDFIEIL